MLVVTATTVNFFGELYMLVSTSKRSFKTFIRSINVHKRSMKRPNRSMAPGIRS
ncbi:hypothetical protein [Sporosarcina sp. P16a]|uniref:hypothetical protein n=1 Tax=Sporosarcina sp. P16a TaxID=2048262 RepID=UPI0013041345|nr:hypothetical protein [Sporosarcina sp. P16a]